MEENGIVILAAGNSSRMGKPKQLLPYGDQSLISYSITEAKKTVGQQVVVVLGAYSDEIEPTITNSGVSIVKNEDWQNGMAGSIRIGLAAMLANHPAIENILFTGIDQPFVSSGLFDEMIRIKVESGEAIVACSYGDTIGIPVLFNRQYFTELQKIEGHQGAKKLLLQYSDAVATMSFEPGALDIDTEEDYLKLL